MKGEHRRGPASEAAESAPGAATPRDSAVAGHNHAIAASPDGPARDGDIDLMRRVRERDEDALAALYDRYAAQVNGLAKSILRDPALSEEAAHDVFLRLWQYPEAYDPGRGAFGGWLLRVTRNRAIDLLRRRHETPTGDQADHPLFRVPDPAPTPEEQALTHLRRQEVHLALAELAPDQRQLLELAYLTGLSQRQIAERLERPLGTVKSQIRSAMRRLADRLAPTEHAPSNTPPEGS